MQTQIDDTVSIVLSAASLGLIPRTVYGPLKFTTSIGVLEQTISKTHITRQKDSINQTRNERGMLQNTKQKIQRIEE